MTKKILAGVLAGVTMLSLSTGAFATTNVKESTIAGTNYDVDAGIVFGAVDAILPATLGTGVNGVRINPYGAAVSTVLEIATTADGDPVTALANNSFIASPYYNVKNNDTQSGLKVLVTASVKKATGLVVVDQSAAAPANFYDAVIDANATNPVKVYPDGNEFNPLVSYDKIAAVKGKEGVYTGGAVSAKQAMNTGISIIGGSSTAELAKLNPTGDPSDVVYTDPKAAVQEGTYKVDLLPKGSAGGTLLWLPIAALDDTTDPDDPTITPTEGYFTVKGDLNPEIDKENYAWGKEALSLNIVLKLVPTYDANGKPAPAPATAATALKTLTAKKGATDKITFAVNTLTYATSGLGDGDSLVLDATAKTGFTVTYDASKLTADATWAAATKTVTLAADSGSGYGSIDVVVTNDADATDKVTYTITIA